MSTATLLPRRALVVWGALALLTLLNLLISDDGPTDGGAFAAVVVLAAIKVRFVGLDFMDLRHAPKTMRLVFEGYCLVLAAVLIAVSLTA